jgi:hypothetical protein
MWELFGFDYFTNEAWETKVNQARLEYYDENDHRRIKYNAGNKAMSWWSASPVAYSSGSGDPSPQSNFNIIGSVGHSDIGVGWPDNYPGEYASRMVGVAPAFCVK